MQEISTPPKKKKQQRRRKSYGVAGREKRDWEKNTKGQSRGLSGVFYQGDKWGQREREIEFRPNAVNK